MLVKRKLNVDVCVPSVYFCLNHKHTHSQLFYGSMDFVRDNPGEPAPEETFTHSHLSWFKSSLICFIHLLRSMASCSIHAPDSLFPQSLSKFSLVYHLAWHPPLHTPYISSPNHCLFATHARAHTITTCFAVVLRLCHLILVCLSTLYLEFCLVVHATHPTTHSHLCLLKCHLIFLPYGPGLTSMQHTTSHATAA